MARLCNAPSMLAGRKYATSNWRSHYIKRIVAVAGDTIEMKDGVLYVNDRELPRRRIGPGQTLTKSQAGSTHLMKGEVFKEVNEDATYRIFMAPSADAAIREIAKTTVPPYHCFVLGDNRDDSWDSRHFGPIPYSIIEGRADYIYWPADRWPWLGRLG
jgi:signal peptidase I